MTSIPGNYFVAIREAGTVSIGERAARALAWIERAHSRRPRQEFWQWLRTQVRAK